MPDPGSGAGPASLTILKLRHLLLAGPNTAPPESCLAPVYQACCQLCVLYAGEIFLFLYSVNDLMFFSWAGIWSVMDVL
jgi:hypothetical protein